MNTRCLLVFIYTLLTDKGFSDSIIRSFKKDILMAHAKMQRQSPKQAATLSDKTYGFPGIDGDRLVLEIDFGKISLQHKDAICEAVAESVKNLGFSVRWKSPI